MQFTSQANVHVKDETILSKVQNDMMIAKAQHRVKRIIRDPILREI
jgi:hypothetical protein